MDDHMYDRIGSMIEIQGGYTSYVDLKLELFDDNRNVGRMSRYRPVASHRQAFESIAQSLNVIDGRCYLLTGAYGTGKSHLCLMFANYLQTPSSEKPMPEFFAHYQEADKEAAADLRSKRRTGKYLIALCDWGAMAILRRSSCVLSIKPCIAKVLTKISTPIISRLSKKSKNGRN